MKQYVSSHLKDMNRLSVYRLLSTCGEISKAEISRRTRISMPTVLKIISYFVDNELVVELGEGDSALGRKPQLLRFNPKAYYSIGVALEGSSLTVGVVDLQGEIATRLRRKVAPDLKAIFSGSLAAAVESAIAKSGVDRARVLGLGIGIPGVVDPQGRSVSFAPLVGVTSKLDCAPILDRLSETLGMEVWVENDANLAAMGEFVARRLSADADLIYLSLGTGLGSGIILDGKLRRGSRFSAGEVGYMVFDPDFESLRSAAGWLEAQVNSESLGKRWPALAEAVAPAGRGEKVAELPEKAIGYVSTKLALGIANMATVLDVKDVVIGGSVADAFGQPLVDALNARLARLSITEVACERRVSAEPGVVGAASLVTEACLDRVLGG